jgi:hypothetical protein
MSVVLAEWQASSQELRSTMNKLFELPKCANLG